MTKILKKLVITEEITTKGNKYTTYLSAFYSHSDLILQYGYNSVQMS